MGPCISALWNVKSHRAHDDSPFLRGPATVTMQQPRNYAVLERDNPMEPGHTDRDPRLSDSMFGSAAFRRTALRVVDIPD